MNEHHLTIPDRYGHWNDATDMGLDLNDALQLISEEQEADAGLRPEELH